MAKLPTFPFLPFLLETTKVLSGGWLTDGYTVEKGVRQGEVLSPFLWVAFTDPLLFFPTEVKGGAVLSS
jgi:hypothetical protein